MMNLLLDTHLLIWVLFGDNRLSNKARTMILNPENKIFYSVISTWEIQLKHAHDPENMITDVKQFLNGCRQAGFLPVNLSDEHIEAAESLSLFDDAPEHKDPFDKLILAQAKTENYLLLTHDKKMTYYEDSCVILV